MIGNVYRSFFQLNSDLILLNDDSNYHKYQSEINKNVLNLKIEKEIEDFKLFKTYNEIKVYFKRAF